MLARRPYVKATPKWKEYLKILSRVPPAGFALSLQVAGYRGLPKQIYSCNEGQHQVTGGNSLEEVLHIFLPKHGVSLFSFTLKRTTHLEINHFLFKLHRICS